MIRLKELTLIVGLIILLGCGPEVTPGVVINMCPSTHEPTMIPPEKWGTILNPTPISNENNTFQPGERCSIPTKYLRRLFYGTYLVQGAPTPAGIICPNDAVIYIDGADYDE